MASSRDIEAEECEEIVGHPDSSPVLRRSSSAESVNDVSPFQEPMMEVEKEFAPTSRPTLRYSEPELAEQTQVPREVRVATHPWFYCVLSSAVYFFRTRNFGTFYNTSDFLVNFY